MNGEDPPKTEAMEVECPNCGSKVKFGFYRGDISLSIATYDLHSDGTFERKEMPTDESLYTGDMKCESCGSAFPVTVFAYKDHPAKAKVGRWAWPVEKMQEAEAVHHLHYDPKRKGWFATTRDGKEKEFHGSDSYSRGNERMEKPVTEKQKQGREIIDRIMENRRLARDDPGAYVRAKLGEASNELQRELTKDCFVRYLSEELATWWIEVFLKDAYTDYGVDPTEYSNLDSYLRRACFSLSGMSRPFLARRIAADFFKPPVTDEKVGLADGILSAADHVTIISSEFEKEFQDKEKMSRFIAEIKAASYDIPFKRFIEQSQVFKKELTKKLETASEEENKKIMLELVPSASTFECVANEIMKIKSIEGYHDPVHPSLKKNLMQDILSLASSCPAEVSERYRKMFAESFKSSLSYSC